MMKAMGSARLQRLAPQVHPAPVADTNASPAGSVSVTVIGPGAGESDGPTSVTVNVYTPSPPAVNIPAWVLVIDKFADAVPAGVVSVEELLAGAGSGVDDDTVAVLTTDAGNVPANTTDKLIGAAAVSATNASLAVHVTT